MWKHVYNCTCRQEQPDAKPSQSIITWSSLASGETSLKGLGVCLSRNTTSKRGNRTYKFLTRIPRYLLNDWSQLCNTSYSFPTYPVCAELIPNLPRMCWTHSQPTLYVLNSFPTYLTQEHVWFTKLFSLWERVWPRHETKYFHLMIALPMVTVTVLTWEVDDHLSFSSLERIPRQCSVETNYKYITTHAGGVGSL